MNTATATITTKHHQFPSIRGAAGEIETSAMANCLMLLSSQHAAVVSVANGGSEAVHEVGRMFACKTCDRKFSSFQALGGHRASHKKVKTPNSGEFPDEVSFPVKPKVHGCKICGVEFPTGQALGGHMRRHRENMSADATASGGGCGVISTALSGVTTEDSMRSSDGNNDGEKKRKMDDVVSEVPILMKPLSSKRVCLDLDLSLSLWKRDEAEAEEREHNVVVEAEKEDEVEEGEIVEQPEEERDFLKLELRQPINC